MMKRLRLMNNHLLMICDASMDADFDDFAKHDGQTDQRTDRQTHPLIQLWLTTKKEDRKKENGGKMGRSIVARNW